LSDNSFKLTTANAMNIGAQQTSESAQSLHQRLQQLITDMEDDHRAVSGNTLPAFRTARDELNQAFDGLTRWCSKNGIELEEGHRDAVTTDDDTQATYRSAQTGLQINV